MTDLIVLRDGIFRDCGLSWSALICSIQQLFLQLQGQVPPECLSFLSWTQQAAATSDGQSFAQ